MTVLQVRFGKIFTDLPLAHDSPVKFGMQLYLIYTSPNYSHMCESAFLNGRETAIFIIRRGGTKTGSGQRQGHMRNRDIMAQYGIWTRKTSGVEEFCESCRHVTFLNLPLFSIVYCTFYHDRLRTSSSSSDF